MTPFEEAVAAGGPLVAAWDYDDNDGRRLVLFKVGSSGWEKVAETEVDAPSHEALHERLVDRGVRIGATYAGSGFVWVADDLGFGVWNETSQTSSGKIASPVVSKVHVTYTAGDPDRRAVSLELKSGGTEVLAEVRSSWPALDITYDHSNLEFETYWAHHLSLHLAIWHLVPLVNDITPYNFDRDLEVARAARSLAKSVGQLPDIGTFDAATIQALGPSKMTRGVALAVAPEASEPATRTVEVRVALLNGKTMAVGIKNGTNAQVAAFLRRVTTPTAVLDAINAALEQQRRDEGPTR
jgi:hypothetical protein